MIAISVDAPADAKRVAEGAGLEFPVLSDQGRVAVRAYGVLEPMSNPFVNPRGHQNFSRSSAFIIDREGIIRWKQVGDMSTHLPPADKLLEVLRTLPRP